MKDYLKEELDALAFNLNVIIEKISAGNLSTAGSLAAEELAKTLSKLQSILSSEERDEEEKNIIVSKLPLLYFQIPKLN